MKEKTFGKESKTLFPNFKTEKSLLSGQIGNNENQNQCEKTELSPEAEIKFFRENERNDLSDGELLKKEKEIGEESKTSFSIFKSVKVVESKTLQNNQLESNENQNQCEKIVELSSEIYIQKTATHPYDVATYRAKSLEGLKNFQKRKLINRVYVPLKNYQFPFRIVSWSKRKFKSKWLREFSWLAYSPSNDGGFCKVCTLFGDEVKHETNATIKTLFSEALTAKKYSYRCLKDHDASTGLHKKAMENYNVVMMQTSGKSMPIEENVQITPSKKQEVRAAIAPIVDTVIVLGRQGLSYRGHRDDSKYHPEPGGYAKESVGNFVEFLQFRVREGDIHLKKHL